MRYLFFILPLIFLFHVTAQNVVDVAMSSCEKDTDPEFVYPNRLINKSFSHDTLRLHLGVVRNCEFQPKIDLFQNGEDTLVIAIENTSEFWAACICCYELIIKATGIKDTNVILINKYLTNDGQKRHVEFKYYPNKFIFPTINEIMDSISENRYQSDSIKVGYWSNYDQATSQLKSKSFYFINENGESRRKWYAVFDENEKLTEVCRVSGTSQQEISDTHCLTGEQYRRYILDKE